MSRRLNGGAVRQSNFPMHPALRSSRSRVLRTLPLAALLAVLALGQGCSNRYIITTNTGAKVITASKPRLVESNYVYRDATGEKVRISSMRVRQIEPYSKNAAGVPLRTPDLK